MWWRPSSRFPDRATLALTDEPHQPRGDWVDAPSPDASKASPLWDAAGMRFTLDFCAQLVADVPCYELGFVPDEHVLDVVRCAS